MRRSRLDMQKEKQAVANTVVYNVLNKLNDDTENIRAAKAKAYISYRNLRECLRKHEEHIKDIKQRGIEALK